MVSMKYACSHWGNSSNVFLETWWFCLVACIHISLNCCQSYVCWEISFCVLIRRGHRCQWSCLPYLCHKSPWQRPLWSGQWLTCHTCCLCKLLNSIFTHGFTEGFTNQNLWPLTIQCKNAYTVLLTRQTFLICVFKDEMIVKAIK